ncbi:putative F-box/LRR-repeat protein At5g41630 [Silene latifolia]|uniref:putative F-box/LRR-repeat protein At5g41630 n=1 Tax=Silene latifolia TaxID=37657 RepID=UPI003D788CFF
MKLRPQKRICSSKDDRDRLSELPDDVIVNILSCMPIVDAVRTVLLRRFGNRWTLIHALKIDMSEYLKNFRKKKTKKIQCRWFRRFIHNVLLLHNNLSIDSFRLHIEINSVKDRDNAGDELKEWTRFALDRQAKEIRLSDSSEFVNGSTSILPNIFTSHSLVTLHLDSCQFDGEFQVKLESLKKLSLDCINMTDEYFQRFISGCPSLKELFIINPLRMEKLSFSAPNIDKLSLVQTSPYGWSNPLSLNFPNLKSLYLEFDVWRMDIIDVSSVRDIYIEYPSCFMKADEVFALNQTLLEKFEGVEVFRLSCNASEEFLRIIQSMQHLQSRWKRVVLELRIDLVDWTNLTRLELLTPCATPELKTITLHGYGRTWRNQLELIQFLLKIAAGLDKLVIAPISRLKEADELEFVKHVSSFPRASPTVRVIFA